jgi:type IV pilus assembly protein PilB
MAVAAGMSSSIALVGLGRALVQFNALSQADAERVTKKSQENKTEFIDELLAAKIDGMNSVSLAKIISESYGHPLVDVRALDLDGLPKDVIDKKLANSTLVLALKKRGNRLFVATSDPTNQQAFSQIQFQTQLQLEIIVAEHDKLKELVEKSNKSATSAINDLIGDAEVNLEVVEEGVQALDEGSEADEAPIVKFLQKIMLDAYEAGASDLHFEPFEKFYRIRFRVDGILKEVAQPPVTLRERIAARLKVISKMDISEKRVPQDGRVKLAISAKKVIDMRVSTLPTLWGEKIVMRILDPSSAKMGIDALGYDPIEKERLMNAIRRPYGMVLVTGPTGSGKTVSLYTCLNILNEPGVNISTAEDPAEINLPGINQVNVNDKAGLTFTAALKSFLRQDPDIIMVGEIRDLETADIAIKAAQTGHMVFSTLHTNDAPSTLTRLMNMGVAPFNIASSVILITAQRLARRLCVHCKQPADIPFEALMDAGYGDDDLDGSWKPYKAVGCEKCGGSGYKGRVGIYQVMPITEDIQRIILSQGNALDIAKEALKIGVRSLRQSGLGKVKQGITSLEEVFAVTNE